LEERYKVLNALKSVPLGLCFGTNWVNKQAAVWSVMTNVYGSFVYHDNKGLGKATGEVYFIHLDERGSDSLGTNTAFTIFESPGSPLGAYQVSLYGKGGPPSSITIGMGMDDPRIRFWGGGLSFVRYPAGGSASIISQNATSVVMYAQHNGSGLMYLTWQELSVGIVATITPTNFQYCTEKYW
jgi:hypothetical protein